MKGLEMQLLQIWWRLLMRVIGGYGCYKQARHPVFLAC